ncbi:10346_t:CDS:2, partial [Gigaspora margarita]
MNSNYDNDSSINLITENLRVGKIRYSALPIEYPPTSEQGIAIVFNIESWESYNIFFDNMQYQRGHPSGGNFVVQKCNKHNDQATESWFVGYSRWWDKNGNGSHFFHKLKNNIDINLLKQLFNSETFEPTSEITLCSLVLSSNSKRKTC